MSDIQKERIEKFLERQDLSDWERNFATKLSILLKSSLQDKSG